MTNRKLLLRTSLASVLLHVLLFLATWNVSLLDRSAPATAQAEAVELVLVDEDVEADRAAAAQPEPPTAFTEVPERLASETPPEQADYLAMYDALAADRRTGGEDEAAPAADREGDFSQVEIAPQDLQSAPGVQVRETPAQVPGRRRSAQQERSPLETGPGGRWDLPQPRPQAGDAPRDWFEAERTPSLLEQGGGAAAGDRGFEFDQLAQGDLTANTAIEGDFSLNTYEWDFAPWMHRFVQDLHRHWLAPPSYGLGVIHGWTRVRLVVERDGRPSAMDIVEVSGHDSLHRASTSALHAFAPYAPLPGDFPEDRLVILLSLHYPQWKH